MKSFLISSLCLITLFGASVVKADEIKVLKLIGKSFYRRGGKSIKLQRKTKLQEGDLIETSKKSFARLQYNDTIVTVAPNSYFKVTPKKNTDENTLGQLLYGHIYADFQKSDIKKRKIKTTFAAMGVRGTKLLIHVTRDEKEYRERYSGKVHSLPSLAEIKKMVDAGQGFSQVCCVEGKVDVNMNNGKSKTLVTDQIVNFKTIGKQAKTKSYRPGVLSNSVKAFGFGF